MTYCVAFLLDKGLVFCSDSSTNAGVDYISSYSKLHLFQPADDRLFVIMAAGNLGTTQAVLNRIRRDIDRHREAATEQADRKPAADGPACASGGTPATPGASGAAPTLLTSLREAGATGEASFILGGQIAGEPHGLYLIYPQGNAVMATPETPFLQIGESKYGKPPLD